MKLMGKLPIEEHFQCNIDINGMPDYYSHLKPMHRLFKKNKDLIISDLNNRYFHPM